ncbi:MAG: hypothetical protein WC659_07250 [Patescibacteria group bacterium]
MTLERFFRTWTSYYLLVTDFPNEQALNAVGLPPELRTENPDEKTFTQIIKFFDPKLPDYNPDPYTRPFDVVGIRKLLHSTF